MTPAACVLTSWMALAGPPWPHAEPVVRTVGDLAVPPGFARVPVKEGSYAAWLRRLPLKDGNPPVRLHDGTEKPWQDGHAAVVDLDVGKGDLQQCADAAIRLRAEYLRDARREDALCFHYTSGDAVPWSRWRAGERPRVKGRKVGWEATARRDAGYASFRAWLANVFTYAGTLSVAAETAAVGDVKAVRAGDVFVMGGSPGHAVTIADVARAADGRVAFLVLQSHMPAQEVHVVSRPGSDLAPWYTDDFGAELALPEWTFTRGSLRRWPDNACARTR
ncbi:MAG: DUF4846 domain-containing protein [Deltaproteobacteria bacterium]|nr:DUF4846 domain-containing protein [Deltaproteobacteria bacterium]